MWDFFKNALTFIRQNPAIMYSMALIFLLPLSLYLSTFFIVDQFQNIIYNNVIAQSTSIRNILRPLIVQDFPHPELMQATINDIAAAENGTQGDGSDASPTSTVSTTTAAELGGSSLGIKNIRVIVREDKAFKVVAAQNQPDVGETVDTSVSFNGEGLIKLAWSEAGPEQSYIIANSQKYWRMVDPLIDPKTKEPYALVVADIPFSGIDQGITDTIWLAFGITSIIILITLVLVLQHTSLFSYVGLSRRLQDQNKAKDDFIRMATHELRSPVTVITAYISSLKEDLAAISNKQQKEDIERVFISIRNLSDLMDDILEVSHLEQGRTDFSPEKIAPGAVVKSIVDGIKPKAEAKGLALTLEGEDFSHRINVNLICFKRIITNLVENSVKYTPAGKVMVSIKVETSKKRCIITVQDTGFGISAEGQSRLFQQFYRVKTQDNQGIPGTGLGLWMSREMARKMGGDIMLESIEHMGSRFFVTFPLVDK